MTPEKFWSLVDQSAGPDACWPWLAGHHPAGYGRVRYPRYNDPQKPATHIVVLLTTGSLPEKGMYVRHACDNPPCCNPTHLLVGTPQENAADMIERTRAWFQKDTCPKGHAWTPENSLPIAGSGGRWKRCRQCMRDNVAANRDHINARRRERARLRREEQHGDSPSEVCDDECA